MNKTDENISYESNSTGMPITLEERRNNSGYPSSFVMVGTSAAVSNTFLMNFPIKKIDDIPFKMHEINPIDPNQKWYWTESWQKAEKEADEAYISNDIDTFDNMDDFINTL